MPEIHICMGSSCFSRGNAENLRVIREHLARHRIAATPVGHLCEGMCSQGPNVTLNGIMHHGVDAPHLAGLLEDLKP